MALSLKEQFFMVEAGRDVMNVWAPNALSRL